MPVHFDSFISKNKEDFSNKLFSAVLTKCTQNAEEIFADNEKAHIHMTNYLKDVNTNEILSKLVFTIKVNEEDNNLEIIDVDITLINNEAANITFLEKLESESDGNEYYNVLDEHDSRFQIETVNRYFNTNETLIDKECKVYLSAFPFYLKIYDNMEDLNKEFGFENPVEIADTGFKVHGYSEEFISPGGLIIGNPEEICSMMIGKILSVKDTILNIADYQVPMTIITIKTSCGIVPVATSRERFDLSTISVGKYLCIVADVKADFAESKYLVEKVDIPEEDDNPQEPEEPAKIQDSMYLKNNLQKLGFDEAFTLLTCSASYPLYKCLEMIGYTSYLIENNIEATKEMILDRMKKIDDRVEKGDDDYLPNYQTLGSNLAELGFSDYYIYSIFEYLDTQEKVDELSDYTSEFIDKGEKPNDELIKTKIRQINAASNRKESLKEDSNNDSEENEIYPSLDNYLMSQYIPIDTDDPNIMDGVYRMILAEAEKKVKIGDKQYYSYHPKKVNPRNINLILETDWEGKNVNLKELYFHHDSIYYWSVKVISKLNSFRHTYLVSDMDGNGASIVRIVNEAVLEKEPQEGDILRMKVCAFLLQGDFYKDDEDYSNSAEPNVNGERNLLGEGALMPIQLLVNNQASYTEEERNNIDHSLDNVISFKGTIKDVNSLNLYMFETDLPQYFCATIQTQFGGLPIYFTAEQFPKQLGRVTTGNVLAGQILISGDVCIGEYTKYIEDNNLSFSDGKDATE